MPMAHVSSLSVAPLIQRVRCLQHPSSPSSRDSPLLKALPKKTPYHSLLVFVPLLVVLDPLTPLISKAFWVLLVPTELWPITHPFTHRKMPPLRSMEPMPRVPLMPPMWPIPHHPSQLLLLVRRLLRWWGIIDFGACLAWSWRSCWWKEEAELKGRGVEGKIRVQVAKEEARECFCDFHPLFIHTVDFPQNMFNNIDAFRSQRGESYDSAKFRNTRLLVQCNLLKAMYHTCQTSTQTPNSAFLHQTPFQGLRKKNIYRGRKNRYPPRLDTNGRGKSKEWNFSVVGVEKNNKTLPL